jgi:hypothetical protein
MRTCSRSNSGQETLALGSKAMTGHFHLAIRNGSFLFKGFTTRSYQHGNSRIESEWQAEHIGIG